MWLRGSPKAWLHVRYILGSDAMGCSLILLYRYLAFETLVRNPNLVGQATRDTSEPWWLSLAMSSGLSHVHQFKCPILTHTNFHYWLVKSDQYLQVWDGLNPFSHFNARLTGSAAFHSGTKLSYPDNISTTPKSELHLQVDIQDIQHCSKLLMLLPDLLFDLLLACRCSIHECII